MESSALVTGCSGFVGRMLVEELHAAGMENIRGLDVLEPPATLAGKMEFLQGSILDDGLLQKAVQGCDLVFHVAAIPDLWLPDKRRFHEVNTAGTEKVLAAASRHNVSRVVYTSTESIVVGKRARSGPADETTPVTLRDMPGPYCRSKFLAEQAARRAAAAGLPVVIVNPTLPVGPGDERLTPPSRMLLGYLNGAYKAYLNSAFNLIHVRDVARGHILAAEHGRSGERYMLAGENLYMSELLQMLKELSGIDMPKLRVPWPLAFGFAALSEWLADHITHKPPAAPLTGVRLARRPMFFDNRKARRELGLEPAPVRQALQEALEDFAARGLFRNAKT